MKSSISHPLNEWIIPGNEYEKLVSITRCIRKSVGLTQKEVSKLTGVSQAQISRYENKSTQIPFEYLEELTHIFNLDMKSVIAGYIDSPPVNKNIPLNHHLFRIRKPYRLNKTTSNSVIFSYLEVLKNIVGEIKANRFMQSLGYDPDCTYNLTLRTNEKVGAAIINETIRKRIITKQNLKTLIFNIIFPYNFLLNKSLNLNRSINMEDLVNNEIKNLSTNTLFTIENINKEKITLGTYATERFYKSDSWKLVGGKVCSEIAALNFALSIAHVIKNNNFKITYFDNYRRSLISFHGYQ